MRTDYLAGLGRTSPTPGPRIGPLDSTQTKNQMLVPENLNPKLQAKCFDVVNLQAQNVDSTIPTVNLQRFSPYTLKVLIHWKQINYFSDDLKAKWEIIKEDEGLAKAAKAAIEANCK